MTVAAIFTETVYALAGAALGPFNTVWPYANPGDVTVQVDRADGTGPHSLTQGVDYTLTAHAPTLSNGGDVLLASHVLTAPAWTSGAAVALIRITPASQPSSFGEAVGFSPAASEQALDNVERQVQELTSRMRRSVSVGFGEVPPTIDQVDSSLWGIDAAGDFLSFVYGTAASKVIGVDAAGSLTFYPWPPDDPDTGGGGGGGITAGSGITVASYDDIRHGNYLQGAGPISIMLADPYKGGVFVPGAAGQRDNGGTMLVDGLGQSWQRVFSGPINAAWFWNAPTGHLGDGSGLAITAADASLNPQWIGLPNNTPYPLGTTWAYVALQEWLYAGLAQGSTPGHVVWNGGVQTKNRPLWAPAGSMNINQGLFASCSGVDITFAERQGSQLRYTGPGDGSIIPVSFDAISYGVVRNLTVIDATTGVAGVSTIGPPILVSLDYSGAHPGLATQQLSLYDWVIVGTGTTGQIGLYFSKSGGNAQGDTILCANMGIFSCETAVALGGANALSINFVEGNIQGATRDGIAVYIGSAMAFGLSLQAAWSEYHQYPQTTQLTMAGADFHTYEGTGGTGKQAFYAIRSEDHVFVIDQATSTALRDSGIAQPAFYGWGANAHWNLGTVLVTGGVINTHVMLVDDGGPDWFVGDPAASTATQIFFKGASPGWTANKWAGRVSWYRFGNGLAQADTINASGPNWIQNAGAPPFPLPDLHLIKISGATGGAAPNWDAAPPGMQTAFNANGWGFYTVAGSNVIHTVEPVVNGMYVAIPRALVVWPDPTQIKRAGALVGMVSGLSGAGAARSFNLVNANGDPLPASITNTGATTGLMGYYGQGIADGQMTWLPLDWDVLVGCQTADNVYVPAGRARNCGRLEIVGASAPNFVRDTELAQGNFSFRNGGPLASVSPASAVAANPITLTAAQIYQQSNWRFGVSIAAFTLNLPVLNDGIVGELRLQFSSGIGGGSVGTWGANIKAAAPTFAIGATGLVTVAKLTWIGNRTGGGAWYVTELQGPM